MVLSQNMAFGFLLRGMSLALTLCVTSSMIHLYRHYSSVSVLSKHIELVLTIVHKTSLHCVTDLQLLNIELSSAYSSI